MSSWISEEPAGGSVSKMVLEGSTGYGGSEEAVTRFEVQGQAQQGSIELLTSGFHSVASGGLQFQVEHRGEVASGWSRI